MRTGDMIKNILKKLVYVRHDKSIAVIFQDLPPKNNNWYLYPYYLLVMGLKPQQVQRLLDLKIVVTSKATIFFLPQNPHSPSTYSQ